MPSTLQLPVAARSALRHLLGLAALAGSAIAQDLNRLEPAPVPAQVTPPPEAAPPESVAPLEFGVLEGEAVILPALRGVAFYATAEAAAADDPAPGVTIRDLPLLDPPATEAFTRLFLERPVSKAGLSRLALGVRSLLRQAGYPFSIVSLPPQDITSGVVRFVVMISKLDRTVRVEGAHYFSEELYREAIRLAPGQSLNQAQLDADVAWLNRNPFRAAVLETRAGDEPGTTQLVLRVREARPVRIFASADNTGTVTTKEERFTAGFNWGNAWGLGHQMTAQWNSSWDFKTLRSGSGAYVVDLPWRHTLSFSGAYARTNGIVTPPFALKGTSWQIAANYDIPLAPRGAYTHAWQLGLDFKASDNNFTFASIPITDNLTHVVQARASYNGQFTSRWGRTSFRATLAGAPGGLTDRNRSRYFSLSRSGAQADYVYVRGDVFHAISLDSIKRGLSWSVRGQFQLANHNLIGSEQFGGGGAYSVRGYEDGEVYKDNGMLLSHELRLPPVSLRAGHTLQFYGFQDYANLWSTEPLPGERAVDLHSAGVGVDYGFGNRISLRAAYGWQFTDSGSSQTGKNSRLHVSANLSF
jgi:hemolysin activation/secretion protein